MPAGSGGQIALFSVGSLYTAVTSALVSGAQWTNFISESIEHTLAELEEASITGFKAAPPSNQGLDSGQGDIQFEPNPNAIGTFLRGVFGQSSGTVVTAAGSWGTNSGNLLHTPPGMPGPRAVVQHRFIPNQNPFDAFTYLPPHGVMVFKDVGSAMAFMGSVFTNIEFQVQAGQLVKASVGLMSRDVQMFTRTTSMAALRNPGGRPWVWDMASVQIGPGVNSLAASNIFESLAIKYEAPMEGVVLLDGTKKYGEFQANGFQRVTLNGTLSFRDYAEYLNFRNYANRFLRLTITNPSSDMVIGSPGSASFFQLAINVPQFKVLTWSTPVQGPNRLTSQFTAKGEFDVTSLYALEVLLTNTTSAYI